MSSVGDLVESIKEKLEDEILSSANILADEERRRARDATVAIFDCIRGFLSELTGDGSFKEKRGSDSNTVYSITQEIARAVNIQCDKAVAAKTGESCAGGFKDAHGREFALLQTHIDLLREGYVRLQGDNCWGTIGLDCKRPFGNSDIAQDMMAILGVDADLVAGGLVDGDLAVEQMETIYKKGLPLALEVILRTGSFVPGVYRTSTPYSADWYFYRSLDGN